MTRPAGQTGLSGRTQQNNNYGRPAWGEWIRSKRPDRRVRRVRAIGRRLRFSHVAVSGQPLQASCGAVAGAGGGVGLFVRCGNGRSYATGPRVHYRRRVIGAALGFLAGVGLLLAGVVVNVILIAVAGFVVMLACSVWAVTSYRRMTGSATGRAPAKDRGSGKKRHTARDRRAGKQAGSGLMGRLGERWRRRQQGDR